MSKQKILVVDDDSDGRDYAKAILEEGGFAVITAADGREAIQKAKEERPDLIVMDVMMPVLNGYEACDELKADEGTRGIPVILLTGVVKHVRSRGRTTAYSLYDGMVTEANDYIPKPVDPDRLLEAVKNLLRTPDR